MRISQVFILSAKGDRLVFRNYDAQKGNQSVDEIFFRKYCYWDEEHRNQAPAGDCPPFFVEMGVYYYFIRVRSMLFVCTSAVSLPPNSIISAMYEMTSVMRDFLGTFNEHVVRNNFTLIYELWDEMICFGVIQDMRTDKLKPFILHTVSGTAHGSSSTETFFDRIRRADFDDTTKKSDASAVSIIDPHAGSGDASELFIDVIERLSMVFSPAGNVRCAEVEGSIVLKSLLQGSPVLRIGLTGSLTVGNSRASTSPVKLDSISFHQSVDSSRFEQERAMTVQPPLGSSTLTVYRSTSVNTPPFRAIHVVEQPSPQVAEVVIRVRADFDGTTTAIGTRIELPLPESTSGASMEFNSVQTDHSFEFNESEKVLSWIIPSFTGGTELLAKARISTGVPIPSMKRELGPLTMTFEIPQHSVSGMNITSLQAMERGVEFKPNKWVRNITQAGAYEFRLH